ncbi:MAG: DUF234 domain-containing protein, partial [Candidatus Omnitrophota bacterium]
FDKGTVSRYLSILDSLHITKKEIPVTEKIPEKSRKGIYIIDDNFINFRFRFIFRNRSFLEERNVSKVLSRIKNSISGLLAKNYEKVSAEILKEALSTGNIPLHFETFGRWWNKNQEIDLLAVNHTTNEILFGEVKWPAKPLGTNIYEELKSKSKYVLWGRTGRKEHFCLFSRAGFTEAMIDAAKKDNVLLFHQDKFPGY